jgi:hypothetical protein
MRWLVVVLSFVFGFLATASAQPSPAPAAGPDITYDDFINLPPEVRRERFLLVSAEHKAVMIQTHAELWLAANHARLSDAQIAAAREAIASVTPRIYLHPADPGTIEQTRRLTQKLTCILGRDNVRRAFDLYAPRAQSADATWRSVLDEWLSWFSDCMIQ